MSSVTRTVLRLHATLWKRSMSSNKSALVLNVFILIYGVMSVSVVLLMVAAGLWDGQPSDYAPLLGGAVGAGVLGYAMLATMMPSGEGQLQPESFSVLPLRAKDLMPGLLLMQIVQLRGMLALVATAATGLVAVIGLPFSVALIPWTMLAMVLSFGIVIVFAETLAMLLASGVGNSASSKDRKSLITFGGFVVAWIAYMMVMNSSGYENMAELLGGIGAVLQWTPLGSAGAMVGHAGAGQWGMALLSAAITVLFLAAGLWLWFRTTEKRLIAPLGRGGEVTTATNTKGLLVPGMKWTVRGAVYSRALRYYRRDARLISQVIMLPVMGAYFLLMGVMQDQPYNAVMGVVLLGVLASLTAINDFGYDGPSTWVNIVSGAKERDLLLARHWASITPSVLIYGVFVVAALALFPQASVAIATVVGVGFLFSTMSINLMLTVMNAFPVAAPGTSPWQDKSGFTAAGLLAAFAGLFVGWVPSLPGLILVVVGYKQEIPVLIWLGLLLVVAVPIGLYFLAIRTATRKVEATYPEIFQKVKAWA